MWRGFLWSNGDSMRESILLRLKKYRTIIVLVLAYKLCFNSFTASFLVPKIFSTVTQGQWQGEFHRFSLFFGVEASKIKILTPNSSVPLFQAERMEVGYSLPSLLWGKISVGPIRLESPQVHLIEKDGIGNWTTLTKPSSSPDKPPPEEPSKPLTEINTYLPITIGVLVQISDFQLDFTKNDIQIFRFENLNFLFDLQSNRFNSLPLGPKAFAEIDTLNLELNSEKKWSCLLQTDELKFEGLVPLHVQLKWNPTNHIFSSEVQVGDETQKFSWKNSEKVIPINLKVLLDYNMQRDTLQVQNFILSVLGDNWFKITGFVENVSTASPNFDIFIEESQIRLKPLVYYFKSFLINLPSLGGEVSLAGTKLAGTLDKLNPKVNVKGDGIVFQQYVIRKMELGLVLELDLKNNSSNDPLSKIKNLELEPLRIDSNFIELMGSGVGKDLFDLNLEWKNLNLGIVTPDLGGMMQGTIAIKSLGKNSVILELKTSGKNMRYSVDRSKSPPFQLDLNAVAKTNLSKEFRPEKIEVQDMQLALSNREKKKALGLQAEVSLELGSGIAANWKRLELTPQWNILMETLPLVLRESLSGLEQLLGRSLLISSQGKFSKENNRIEAESKFLLKLPGLELDDLGIGLSVSVLPDEISIKNISLSAYKNLMKASISGKLSKLGKEKASLGDFYPDIQVNLGLQGKEKSYLFKGISFQGDLGVKIKILGSDILGELQSIQSIISIKQGECPGETCKLYVIDRIQAQIPFHHQLNWNKKESLVLADKSPFIKNAGRMEKPNFSIHQVVGTHPNVPNLPMLFLSPQGNKPALQARIEYVDNYASLDQLKAYSLDGVILGNDLLFSIGKGDPKNMEFRGNLQIRDIDLKQLLAPKVRDKIDDGKLKADLNLIVRDFTDPIANLDLFFSIFRIGSDFGKSAMNVISPQNFLVDRITDSYAISKIEVSLSKGLVYADVFFRRSLLSLLVNLEDSRISQERMPLASFLKRARTEIDTYQ